MARRKTGRLTATQRTDFTVVTTQIRNAIKLAASWDGLKQSRESGAIAERRRETAAAIGRISAPPTDGGAHDAGQPPRP